MKKLTMNDRWEIHKKLEEANRVITNKLYSIDENDLKGRTQLLLHQINIEKIMFELVYE